MSAQPKCTCPEDGIPWHNDPNCPIAKSELAQATGSARASVRLKVSDWEDLINFVNGDLANMPCDDPIATQMRGILDAIRTAIVKAECGNGPKRPIGWMGDRSGCDIGPTDDP